MYRSIYDIIGKKINLVVEYEKLYDIFNYSRFYEYKNSNYSLAGLFNLFIEDWKYRKTYRTIDEIYYDLALNEETSEE